MQPVVSPKSLSAFPSNKGRDRWIPWSFFLGFLVVIVANGTLIWFALSTFGGLYVEQPYSRGLTFNEALARAESSTELGWSMALDVEDGRVTVFLSNAEGQGLEALSLRGQLVQPLGEAVPVELTFAPLRHGRYRGEVGDLAPGRWELRLVAERGADRFAATSRFVIAP